MATGAEDDRPLPFDGRSPEARRRRPVARSGEPALAAFAARYGRGAAPRPGGSRGKHCRDRAQRKRRGIAAGLVLPIGGTAVRRLALCGAIRSRASDPPQRLPTAFATTIFVHTAMSEPQPARPGGTVVELDPCRTS